MNISKPEKPVLGERHARRFGVAKSGQGELLEFQRLMAGAKLYTGVGLAFVIPAYLWLNWPQPHDHNWALFGMVGALVYGLPLAWSGFRRLDR